MPVKVVCSLLRWIRRSRCGSGGTRRCCVRSAVLGVDRQVLLLSVRSIVGYSFALRRLVRLPGVLVSSAADYTSSSWEFQLLFKPLESPVQSKAAGHHCCSLVQS